jgi:hypothetical protein
MRAAIKVVACSRNRYKNIQSSVVFWSRFTGIYVPFKEVSTSFCEQKEAKKLYEF